jgi:hypothetical protein
VKERTGALVVLSSPVFNAARRQVVTLTGRSRLPSIMAFPGYAEDGGLIGYGPHLRSMFGQAGDPRGDDPGLAPGPGRRGGSALTSSEGGDAYEVGDE